MNNSRPDHHSSRNRKRRRLTVILSVAFAIALIMGPGPGLYLVNPDPNDPSAVFVWVGMPVIYLWAIFWFGVQASVVLIAYRVLWRADAPTANDPRP